ncbi:MAG: hypothetical protein AAGH15_27270 [Myxococcota bacterium]
MRRVMGVAVAASLAACGGSAPSLPPELFVVTYQAVDARGQPLAGVQIAEDGELAGTTDDDGLHQSFIEGAVGTSRRLEHACPEGYAPPEGEGARTLQLRAEEVLDPHEARLGIRVHLRCIPARVRVAVIAETGEPGIGVSLGGRTLGQTGPDGSLIQITEVTAGATLALAFDATTSEADLQPARMERVCPVGTSDGTCFQRVRFEEVAPRRRRARRTPRAPRAPVGMRAPRMSPGIYIPEAF